MKDLELTFLAKTEEGHVFMSYEDFNQYVFAEEDLKGVSHLQDGCLYRIEPGASCELIGYPAVEQSGNTACVHVEIVVEFPGDPHDPDAPPKAPVPRKPLPPLGSGQATEEPPEAQKI